MTIKTFKPIDEAERESARARIDMHRIIERLQNHFFNSAAYPITQSQLKAAQMLLDRVVPVLKVVERVEKPAQPLTREQLIARLTTLIGSQQPVGTPAPGAGEPDRAAEVRH